MNRRISMLAPSAALKRSIAIGRGRSWPGGRQQVHGFRSDALRLAHGVRPGPPAVDFAHHATNLARLNHGSFGAVPQPVLNAQNELRMAFLSQPDEWYFTSKLHKELQLAAESCFALLHSDLSEGLDLEAPGSPVCLVENATVATVAIARRWARLTEPGDVIAVFDTACQFVFQEECTRNGAELLVLKTPFPATSADEIVESITKQLASHDKAIRFAFVDLVSSQPAILLPTGRLITALRSFASSRGLEVAVDGAHAVGSLPNLQVAANPPAERCLVDLGADFFFSNLHKWSFAPPTATVLWAAAEHLLRATAHPITSWDRGSGIAVEARFTGSRDYSAMLAVPAAVQYLNRWRSCEGEDAARFGHRQVLAAAAELSAGWGVPDLANGAPELVATQAMVQLPPALRVSDAPGQPGGGVRQMLREEYGVEAAIGSFGGLGAFVRLSFGVYNTPEEVARLRDGVLDILRRQQR